MIYLQRKLGIFRADGCKKWEGNEDRELEARQKAHDVVSTQHFCTPILDGGTIISARYQSWLKMEQIIDVYIIFQQSVHRFHSLISQL